MAKEPTEFQRFLQVWTDEKIGALGFRGVDPGNRETMLRRRADELRDSARKRGFLGQLAAHAKQHGDVRGYVSALYRAAEGGASPHLPPE
jgi:hypothetical protein